MDPRRVKQNFPTVLDPPVQVWEGEDPIATSPTKGEIMNLLGKHPENNRLDPRDLHNLSQLSVANQLS